MEQAENLKIEIEISDPQEAVMASRQQLILNMAGQGGGKSQVIGYRSATFIENFPEAKGFIGANTEKQLSQSTLTRVFDVWARYFGYDEYDKKASPSGVYVINKQPPPHFTRFHRFNNYDGIISFWNGCTVFIGSLENYKAHDGKEFAWAELDETKDTNERALTEVILGRLRQYGLWFKESGELLFNARLTAEEYTEQRLTAWNPLCIHTSPAEGGTAWLNRMFDLNDFAKQIKKEVLKKEDGYFFREWENKCVVIYSTYHNQRNLPPNYISNQLQNQLDEAILRVVYGYPFGGVAGASFPYFSREKHVKPVTYKPGETVYISLDFNVVPYMTCLCFQVEFVTRYTDDAGKKYAAPAPGLQPLDVAIIRQYKEYCLETPHNTTEAICERFAGDHNPEVTEVIYYGDATGLNRIPGLAKTNFQILEDNLWAFLHNNSKGVRQPNVGNFTRIDFMNRIFAGKIPYIEIEIDPSCEKTIEDFEDVKIGKKGKVKKRELNKVTNEREEKTGHTSDAHEYFVSEMFKEYI